MRAWALALLLLVPGCVTRDAPAPASPSAPSETTCPANADCLARPASGANRSGERPVLPLGRSFSYRADGIYDTQKAFTFVVAKREGEGYLLAGASTKDTEEAMTWGRDWAGPLDASLNAKSTKWFDWPLAEGKAWEAWKGTTVTARAATVLGESGWRIEGKTARGGDVAWTYSPSIGFLVSYMDTTKEGKHYLHIELEKTGTAREWAWFERGAGAITESGQAPATFQVPDGFDAVILSMGGTAGRASVAPPGDAPATWEAKDHEEWVSATLPAKAGVWTVAAVAPPTGGFSYAQADAVKWVKGSV